MITSPKGRRRSTDTISTLNYVKSVHTSTIELNTNYFINYKTSKSKAERSNTSNILSNMAMAANELYLQRLH